MTRKNIQNIIHDNNLEPFMKDAQKNIFSVYFLDDKTNSPKFALLCHASLFTDAYSTKNTKEKYTQKLSESFRILPVDEANTFKTYLGIDLSENLTTTHLNEKNFDILKANSDPRDYAFKLLSSIDEKNNLTINGIYPSIPTITFNEDGKFIPSDSNPCDLPEL